MTSHGWIRSALVAGGLLTAACSTLPPPTASMLPAARSEPEWVARERALAAETARGGVDLVFLGDSITEGWRFVGLETWQRYYAGRRPLNLGISADQIQHALWRIQHGNFAAIEPRAIVVQIGTNNLLADTPSEVAGGVLEVVRTLRRLEPQAHILVMGLFPRDRDPDGELRRRVAAVNRELEARVARGRKVSYLDIGAKFLEPDGSISPEVMYDYVHLAPRGYQIWAREIEPILARWLGPASAAAR